MDNIGLPGENSRANVVFPAPFGPAMMMHLGAETPGFATLPAILILSRDQRKFEAPSGGSKMKRG
jgi:hypothetical protein